MRCEGRKTLEELSNETSQKRKVRVQPVPRKTRKKERLQRQHPGSNGATLPDSPQSLHSQHTSSASTNTNGKLISRSLFGLEALKYDAILSDLPPVDDIELPYVEDLSEFISLDGEVPKNISGHFCDLFVGTHMTKGKVALKRPRIAQSAYTRLDVRVSA